MRYSTIAVVVVALAAGCGRPAVDDDARTRETERVRLRDGARVVLETHCGDCHIPDSPRALPRALAVYDLRRLEWANTMTPAQLTALGTRIVDGAFFDPFDTRNRSGPPPKPSAADIATVQAYVRAELAARASHR